MQGPTKKPTSALNRQRPSPVMVTTLSLVSGGVPYIMRAFSRSASATL